MLDEDSVDVEEAEAEALDKKEEEDDSVEEAELLLADSVLEMDSD